MQIRLNSLLLMISLLLLSACDQFENNMLTASEQMIKDIRPVDKHGRAANIGNLGGKAMAIPGNVYMEGWIRYQQNPNDFELSKKTKAYRKKKSNQISYDQPIEKFSFDMRITDGAVRMMGEETNQAYLDDRAKYAPKGEPCPWTDVSVEAIKPDDNHPLNQNAALNAILKPSAFKYHYQLQNQRINALIWYRANRGTSSDTGKSWEDFYNQDILVNRDHNSNVSTMIMCDVTTIHVPRCTQNFTIPTLKAGITISYNRHYLPQWQQMETYVRNILNSWLVNPDEVKAKQ